MKSCPRTDHSEFDGDPDHAYRGSRSSSSPLRSPDGSTTLGGGGVGGLTPLIAFTV